MASNSWGATSDGFDVVKCMDSCIWVIRARRDWMVCRGHLRGIGDKSWWGSWRTNGGCKERNAAISRNHLPWIVVGGHLGRVVVVVVVIVVVGWYDICLLLLMITVVLCEKYSNSLSNHFNEMITRINESFHNVTSTSKIEQHFKYSEEILKPPLTTAILAEVCQCWQPLHFA